MRPTTFASLPILLFGLAGCFGTSEAMAPQVPIAPDNGAEPAPPDSGWTGGAEAEPRAAGVGYVERTTGGAAPDEQLPMIVAMHGRGGSPRMFERMFATFPARARLIIPHGGTPDRSGYSWYPVASKRDSAEVFAAGVRPVVDQLAAAIGELRTRRPTAGRAVVCGFSQGGVLSFSLAVLHPEQVAAAFPLSGHLPYGFANARPSGPIAFIHAFHGTRDRTYERARESVDELHRLGIRAEFTEYSMGHELGSDEVREVLSDIAGVVSHRESL